MSSVSIPSEYKSELSHEGIEMAEVEVLFSRKLTKMNTFKNSDEEINRGTKETDDKDNGSDSFPLVRKLTVFQKFQEENAKLLKFEQSAYAPLMSHAQSIYHLQ
jgi:hypothetical protein